MLLCMFLQYEIKYELMKILTPWKVIKQNKNLNRAV